MSIGPTLHAPNRSVRLGALVAVFSAIALCGWVDYRTGYELSVFALYAVPITLSVRFFGVKGGCISALLCTLVWIAADVGAGHHYAQWWVVYWNALHRLFFFGCVVVGFHYARATLGANVRPVRALAGPLPVCTQCHRIGAPDGHWQKFESYLCEHAGTQPLSKVCPDCARESYAKAGFIERVSPR
jgi:hypothetical protein